MNQGWQCPECKKVYAPSITECVCAMGIPMMSSDFTRPQFIYPCPAKCDFTGGCNSCRPQTFLTQTRLS